MATPTKLHTSRVGVDLQFSTMSVLVSVANTSDIFLDDPSTTSTQDQLMMFTSSPVQGPSSGVEDEDAIVDPITPTNSSNNLQALLRSQPGFFSSDTEVDDPHDSHEVHGEGLGTPEHEVTSPKAHFYFPGPLPAEPVTHTVRVLSYPPPHPQMKKKVRKHSGGRSEEERQRHNHLDMDLADGPETPQLERAIGGGGQHSSTGGTIDREPGRDYSRRFYIPDAPSSVRSALRPKSPEKSPPPMNMGNHSSKRSNLHISPSSSSSALLDENMGTPVVVSKAPPHPYTKRIDSNTSMSSEVELAATTGSTSSSRATIEAKFQVRVSRVEEGEEVRISGNDTVLGAWDVTKSVPMTRSPE